MEARTAVVVPRLTEGGTVCVRSAAEGMRLGLAGASRSQHGGIS